MSENAFRVVWKWLAPALLAGGLLAWAHSVGGSVSNPVGFGYSSQSAVLFSLPLLSLIGIATYWLAHEYASLKQGQPWQYRIPLYFFDPKDVDLTSRGGTLIQTIALVAFYIIPPICLIVLWVQFQQRRIYCNNPIGQISDSASLLPTPTRSCSSFLRYAEQSGPQYYSLASPWIYLALTLIALIFWARAVKSIAAR